MKNNVPVFTNCKGRGKEILTKFTKDFVHLLKKYKKKYKIKLTGNLSCKIVGEQEEI